MDSKIIDKGNYKLHVYKTDKFKNVIIDVVFSNIVKENLHVVTALKELLYMTSKCYKTKRDRYIKEEELYSEQFSINLDRYGRLNTLTLSIDFINPKLVNDIFIEEAIKYPFDIFNNPLFDESYLDKVKDKMKFTYKRIIEQPESYANRKAFESFYDNKEDNLQYFVEDEIVDTITMKQIEDMYNYIVNNSNIDVFLLGDVDDEYIKNIDKNLIYKSVNKDIKYLICNSYVDESKKIIETKNDINQAQIINIYNTPEVNNRERVALDFLRIILGSGFESRLFRIVREQHHLCYSIYARLNVNSCNMIICTGVDNNNIDKARELIDDIFNNFSEITDEEYEATLAKKISGFESIYDSLSNICSRIFGESVLNRMTLEEEIEITKSMTKEEILKLKDNIKINTEYVLKGEE